MEQGLGEEGGSHDFTSGGTFMDGGACDRV